MFLCNNCFSKFDTPFEACPSCGYKEGDAPEQLYHLYPGTKLHDRYIIGQVLGFGGFGITYKAYDTQLEIIAAIKEYYPSGIVSREPKDPKVNIYNKARRKEYLHGKEGFLDEARNMAKFSSEPDIINVLEYFEENNTAYIVMEFLDGITLSRFISENGGAVDVDTAIQISETVCNALIKIHKEGIIHRDVSPKNIFLCLNGHIKLIDFGAARFSQSENKEMTIVLTPGFAPPEQYEKVIKQGPWTDIYALGATMYYILTGVRPVESTNRTVCDDLPYPHEINADIPENMSNTVMKAMAMDIHMRFDNVKDLLEALKQNKKVLPVAVEKKRKKRKRTAGLGLASLMLVGGTFAGLYMWNKEKAEETLPDCELTLWYCKSGDQQLDDAELAAYTDIVEDFNASFPNVKVNIEGFEENEYSEKLKNSSEKPNLYEYTDETADAKTLSLKSIYSSNAAKQCSLLKDAPKCFGEKYGQLPLGFAAPAVFVNTTLSEYDESSISKMQDMTDIASGNAAQIVTDSEMFSEVFGDMSAYYDANGAEQFFSENAVVYAAYTTEYLTVRDRLPAMYKMLFCNTDPVPCRYTNIWRACDLDGDENKASLRLLEFMLNNNAQDELHVKNISQSLPINDAVLEVYVSVYDDFTGFFDNKSNYVFVKE